MKRLRRCLAVLFGSPETDPMLICAEIRSLRNEMAEIWSGQNETFTHLHMLVAQMEKMQLDGERAIDLLAGELRARRIKPKVKSG